MNTERLVTQFKREFWENKGSFFYLPLIIAAFYLGIMVLGYVALEVIELDFSIHIEESDSANTNESSYEGEGVPLMAYLLERIGYVASLPDETRAERVTALLYILSMPFSITVLFVTLFYLLDTIHGERKDRSILFWKSLPVSDAMTVLVKLATGVVLVPLFYAIVAIVTQFLAMLVGSVLVMSGGYSAMEIIWGPAMLGPLWGIMLTLVPAQVLWSAPLYSWVLLVSAWARSSLFLWAVGVPIALVVTERALLPEPVLSAWFMKHASPLFVQTPDMGRLVELTASVETLLGVVVAAAMVYGVIYLRGRADEI